MVEEKVDGPMLMAKIKSEETYHFYSNNWIPTFGLSTRW